MSEIYYGFRLKCIVKPEFKPLIDSLFDYGSWKRVVFRKGFEAFPFITEFAKLDQCDDIPFANVDNFPHWEKEHFTEGYEWGWSHRFMYQTMEWRFQTCTTEMGLIASFIMIILNRIVVDISHCEIYKENDQPKFYLFRG